VPLSEVSVPAARRSTDETLVVDVVCSELPDPLRAAKLERRLRDAFRDRQKASLKGPTRLERRLAELHDEKLAKLDGFRHGIDPALIRDAIAGSRRRRTTYARNSPR
jgi:hypothetical protein